MGELVFEIILFMSEWLKNEYILRTADNCLGEMEKRLVNTSIMYFSRDWDKPLLLGCLLPNDKATIYHEIM